MDAGATARRARAVAERVVRRESDRIEAHLAIATAACVILYRFVVTSSLALTFPYPLDYGEGAVLDVALRLARHEDIYPAALAGPPWFVANYPPVYYIVRAALISFDGSSLWHGRLLSQISALATACFIAGVLFRISQNRVSAAIGGATFLTVPFVVAWAQYDRVDLLALALNWAGLWSVVRRQRATWTGVLCFVGSGFTRQTGPIAGILAAYLWLWERKKTSEANRLVLWIGGSALSLLLALNALTGGGFVFHVITGTAGPLSGGQFVNLTRQAVELMPILLLFAGGVLLIALWERPRGWLPVAGYTLGAVLLSLMVAKVGSYINYFLDLSAACALAAGAGLAWVRPRRLVTAGLLGAIAVQMVLMAANNPLYDHLSERLQAATGYARLAEIVRAAEAPVLADEALALIPLQGRLAPFHPFAMTQLAEMGRWDESRFIGTLRAQRYSALLLRIPERNPRILRNMWTDGMAAAITANYEAVESVPVDDRAVIAVYRRKRIR